MKKLLEIIHHHLVTCHICHGMGVREMPNGDTKKCVACNGKGYR